MEFPEISAPPIHDIAYVWLLMKGDSYLPGIITSVFSVLRTDPSADLVVMVTPDVTESAVEIILKVATHVFYVPYLSFETAPMKTKKQMEIYQNWYDSAYTKWNMLALPYKKAIFIDADIVATTNVDNLFDLATPAAPFNSPFAKPLGTIPNFTQAGKYKKYSEHGVVITPNEIKKMLYEGGITLTATAVVLSPSIAEYKEYIEMVKAKAPYGSNLNCHSAPDERSIAEFYSLHKGIPWVNVHHQYNYIGWKKGFLKQGEMPLLIHYFSSTKPWSMKYDEYPDVIGWYKIAGEAIKHMKIAASDIFLEDSNIKAAESARDEYIRKFTKSKKIKSILDVYKFY